MVEPNPDSSRLLSDIPDIEIKFSGTAIDLVFGKAKLEPDAKTKIEGWVQQIRSEQDAHTASIVRAECEENLAEITLSVNEAARASTLKEVGEWLEKDNKNYWSGFTHDYPSYRLNMLREALRKGEMPE